MLISKWASITYTLLPRLKGHAEEKAEGVYGLEVVDGYKETVLQTQKGS